MSQTSRTFLSNSLFSDITWKALRFLNSLSVMAWQQYKQQVLNSNEELELSFLGEGCPLSEFEFFRFKSCSIVLELTYLARQAIYTHSPLDIVQLSPHTLFSSYNIRISVTKNDFQATDFAIFFHAIYLLHSYIYLYFSFICNTK